MLKSLHLTVLKSDTLKTDKSSKCRVIAAADVLTYIQIPSLVQNKSSKRGVCLHPGDVRFEDCQLVVIFTMELAMSFRSWWTRQTARS
jgi:hypothetical protein